MSDLEALNGVFYRLIKKAHIFHRAEHQIAFRHQFLNFNNGHRFETYVIEEKENSGIIALYGPAARLGEIKDKICIISYVFVSGDEVKKIEKKVVLIDQNNKAAS